MQKCLKNLNTFEVSSVPYRNDSQLKYLLFVSGLIFFKLFLVFKAVIFHIYYFCTFCFEHTLSKTLLYCVIKLHWRGSFCWKFESQRFNIRTMSSRSNQNTVYLQLVQIATIKYPHLTGFIRNCDKPMRNLQPILLSPLIHRLIALRFMFTECLTYHILVSQCLRNV